MPCESKLSEKFFIFQKFRSQIKLDESLIWLVWERNPWIFMTVDQGDQFLNKLIVWNCELFHKWIESNNFLQLWLDSNMSMIICHLAFGLRMAITKIHFLNEDFWRHGHWSWSSTFCLLLVLKDILSTFVANKIFIFLKITDREWMHKMKTSDSQEILFLLIYYSPIPLQSIPVPFLQTKHGEWWRPES